MQVEHHVHLRPDRLPHERGNPVRDPAQRGGDARPLDKRPIEIHAVIQRAVARSCHKRGWIQHRNQDNPPQHILDANLAHEPLDRHRPFILIPMIGPKRHQALARTRLGPHENRERNEMVAPKRVVLERDPVVAPAWGFKVELVGTYDLSCHDF
jgi:hypothetical protein